MEMDPVSREIGILSGSFKEFAEYTKSATSRLEAKMDAAADDRARLFDEIKTVNQELHNVKHDQRGVEQKVEIVADQVIKVRERQDQIDSAHAKKLDHIVEVADEKLEKAEARIAKLERWQDNLIGRMSALGLVGSFLGGVIGYVLIHWVGPLIDRVGPLIDRLRS
jgi:chromosome segregation ATPase